MENICEFKDIKQEDLLISKIITSITDKKLWEKLIRNKDVKIKATMDIVTQKGNERRHEQSTIPTAFVKKGDEARNSTENRNATKTRITEDKNENNNFGTAQKKNYC